MRSFESSIFIRVSYYIPLPNGSAKVVSQPFYQPSNLSLSLSRVFTLAENKSRAMRKTYPS